MHRIGRDLPAAGAQPVGEIIQGEAGTLAFADRQQTAGMPSPVAVVKELERSELGDLAGQVLADA